MINSECGIAAMGFYLPEKEIPLLELAEKAGIPAFVAEYAGTRTVREAAVDKLPSQMAIKAAEAALQNSEIDPEEIDLIIYCGVEVPDYIMPPSAGKVQDAIGANQAITFDLAQGCCGMLTGMQIAKAQINLNEGCNTVMLVTGDKWSQFTHHHAADSVFFGERNLRPGHAKDRHEGNEKSRDQTGTRCFFLHGQCQSEGPGTAAFPT